MRDEVKEQKEISVFTSSFILLSLPSLLFCCSVGYFYHTQKNYEEV